MTGPSIAGLRIPLAALACDNPHVKTTANTQPTTQAAIASAHDSSMRFRDGLTNEGTAALTGGFNDVFGEVVVRFLRDNLQAPRP